MNTTVKMRLTLYHTRRSLSKGRSDPMPDSDYEEADTRMCLHVLNAAWKEAHNMSVTTVDTDVVVILIGIFHKLTGECGQPLARDITSYITISPRSVIICPSQCRRLCHISTHSLNQTLHHSLAERERNQHGRLRKHILQTLRRSPTLARNHCHP